MELTAKTLQEVTFGSSKVRGYNPAEVDQFIEAVAEGVEELRERLRRAVERATRAEQAAAQAGTAAPAASPSAPPAGQPEISKVWERAVAAAEQAVTEAKAEADRLLNEARQHAEARTSSANQEADSRLSSARSEADSTVANARSEAARLSEESQAKLREDIAQLEHARDVLKGDVDALAGFLSSEKERLRGHMHQALGALDSYGTDPNNAPALREHSLPDAPEPAPSTAPAFSYSAPDEEPEPEPEPAAAPAVDENGSDMSEWQTPTPPLDAPQFSEEAVTSDTEEQAWSQSEWTAPEEAAPAEAIENNGWGAPDPSWGEAMPGEPEPPQISWGDNEAGGETAAAAVPEAAATPEPEEEKAQVVPEAKPEPEEEGDPFLAELRKAVQDDGPLGPREETTEDQSSIDSLYANEDDDRSGFFRRKK